jgi:hypothetical protein
MEMVLFELRTRNKLFVEHISRVFLPPPSLRNFPNGDHNNKAAFNNIIV